MAKGQSGNAFNTDFTTLFSGIPTDNKKTESKVIEPIVQIPPKNENNTQAIPKPEKKNEPVKKSAENDNNLIKTPSPEVDVIPEPQTPSKPENNTITTAAVKNPKSIIAAANNEIYMNIFMITHEERDYIKFRSSELEMSTSDFFVSLVDEDTEKIKQKKLDLNDEGHINFKALSLTVNTSIKVKKEIKKQIKQNSIRHRMSVQRYCAYIIHQAFLNDDEWY